MRKNITISKKVYWDGDLISFIYKDKEEKGLLFFNEIERKFMVLLTNDYVVPVEEIKNVNLSVYESK